MNEQLNLNLEANFIKSLNYPYLNENWLLFENWKWVLIFATIGISYFLKNIIQNTIHNKKDLLYELLNKSKENSFFKMILQEKIEDKVSWICCTLFVFIVLDNLNLPIKIEKYTLIILKLALVFQLIKLFYMFADASGNFFKAWSNHSSIQLDDQIAPLITKTLKILVVVLGSLILLDNIGIKVTPLLTGLGIGGVALAFAAQDTVANVFGTVTILFDSPFKIGDKIKLNEIEGTVEEVGFRSTRIRTPQLTLVTISNATMAKEKIENFNARDGIIRFRQTYQFSYLSKPAQLEFFCEQVKYYLFQDSATLKDKIQVNVNQYSEKSIEVLVLFYFKPNSQLTESHLVQKFLLQIHQFADQAELKWSHLTDVT